MDLISIFSLLVLCNLRPAINIIALDHPCFVEPPIDMTRASTTTSHTMNKATTPPPTTVPAPMTPLHSSLRQVPLLEGPSNYDEWIETLLDNFARQGLDHFITSSALFPPDPNGPEYASWDHDRQLAKQIIKLSTAPVADALLAEGWRPKHKDPKHHYDFARALVIKTAEAEGLTAGLVGELCRIDRGDFMSLASYQGRLQRLKQRLTNLGYTTDERLYLHIAINGLKGTNRRWAALLQELMTEGRLTWQWLMVDMYDKAVRERGGAVATIFPRASEE